ncbi:MAG: Cox family DNA-binding protein [Rouxiella badensis]|uniref:Cox family DNA-binding protein n=1 Tax=Rouxiella badensis TaxID=1646377 RepID=UPI003C3FFE40
MSNKIVSVSDAIPYPEFARLIGKTPEAVKGMIEKNKLPIVEMRNPENPTGRAESWVYLPAWNTGLKLAFDSRPKEIRDGWLMWLGLGEPSA